MPGTSSGVSIHRFHTDAVLAYGRHFVNPSYRQGRACAKSVKSHVVFPEEAGIQDFLLENGAVVLAFLGPGFRRKDGAVY